MTLSSAQTALCASSATALSALGGVGGSVGDGVGVGGGVGGSNRGGGSVRGGGVGGGGFWGLRGFGALQEELGRARASLNWGARGSSGGGVGAKAVRGVLVQRLAERLSTEGRRQSLGVGGKLALGAWQSL